MGKVRHAQPHLNLLRLSTEVSFGHLRGVLRLDIGQYERFNFFKKKMIVFHKVDKVLLKGFKGDKGAYRFSSNVFLLDFELANSLN